MPIHWIFIQLFVNTVEIGTLFYLLCNKFTAKYKTFIFTLFFIIGNISLIMLSKFISFGSLPTVEILVPITCFIYLLFFRNGGLLKKIFWTVISFALLYSAAYFAITIIAISSSINSIDAVTPNSNELLLTMIIAKTLQVVIFYTLAKKKQRYETKSILTPIPMLICFTIPLISFIILVSIHALIIDGLHLPENVIFLISISYLTINIIVFILYEIINKETEKSYILIAKNKQYEITERHNSQVIDIYKEMREWRHDFLSHMQLVSGMLEKSDSNNSEVINYIKNLDEKIKSTSLDIVTGNLIVDAIVSAKATLASVHNIKFEHNILLPDDIFIEDIDLCSILSNLLDNAIEACCKLNKNRYINIEMLTFKSQFNIKITNAANGEYKLENGKFKTTKKGDLHGIGMGHVKSIVESYRGIFDIKPEIESFAVHISMPMTMKSAK
jgi:hypothetical protein